MIPLIVALKHMASADRKKDCSATLAHSGKNRKNGSMPTAAGHHAAEVSSRQGIARCSSNTWMFHGHDQPDRTFDLLGKVSAWGRFAAQL
jgi:hypothetical protein